MGALGPQVVGRHEVSDTFDDILGLWIGGAH